MNDAELLQFLLTQGYYELQYKNGVLVGLSDYMFTTGIVVGLTEFSYERRYCYSSKLSAHTALNEWDGNDHPSGPWIKVKGRYQGKIVDEINPNMAE